MTGSLFTNVSAQTALQTLGAASKSLSETQNRVSTGFRVNDASDNAAYWSIATVLRSDTKALNAVSDALGLGAATVDVVYTGLNDTKDLLDEIKSKLVTASQSGVPREQVQAEISQLQNRLKDVSKSTVINGESWLTQDSSTAGYNSQKNVVGSFTRAGGAIALDNIVIDITKTKLYELDGTIRTTAEGALSTVAYNTDATASPVVIGDVINQREAFEAAAKTNADNNSLGIFDKIRTVAYVDDGSGTMISKAIAITDIDISKLTDSELDRDIMTSYLKATDDALQELTLSASVIGAAKSRIEGNQTFVGKLIDANERGIGKLVDADLNKESARLKALQTQEQLAIQALSIANGSSQNLLSLFR